MWYCRQNPTHQFSDTGWQQVTLVVYNNTCADTLTIRNAVYINPPVSMFSVVHDCENQQTKEFKDLS